jgi:hypothetical protein
MRWTLACAIFCLALPLASQPLSPSAGSPSSGSSETPLPLSQRLNDLATTLEQATTDSSADWEILSQVLTEHSRKLEELATLSKGSEREMESIGKSLDDYKILLKKSMAREQATRLQLSLTRWVAGTGAVALTSCAIALGYFLGHR